MRRTFATAILAGALLTAGAAPAIAFADHPDAATVDHSTETAAVCIDSHVGKTSAGLPIFTDIHDAIDYVPEGYSMRVEEGEHSVLNGKGNGTFEHRESLVSINGVRQPNPVFDLGENLHVTGGVYKDAAGSLYYPVNTSSASAWIKAADGLVIQAEYPDYQPPLTEPGEPCVDPVPATESAEPAAESPSVTESTAPVVDEQPAPTPGEPAAEPDGSPIVPLAAGGVIIAGLAGLGLWDRAKRKKNNIEEHSNV